MQLRRGHIYSWRVKRAKIGSFSRDSYELSWQSFSLVSRNGAFGGLGHSSPRRRVKLGLSVGEDQSSISRGGQSVFSQEYRTICVLVPSIFYYTYE